ncbi:hypothetical protein GCM10028801_06880 [Nocardioides maradonensis]
MSGLRSAERKVPIPVVRCDVCGTTEPLRLQGTKYGDAADEADEAQRTRELRDAGWLLTPVRDLCPHCHNHDRQETTP